MRFVLVLSFLVPVISQGPPCGPSSGCSLTCNDRGLCCFGNVDFQSDQNFNQPTYLNGEAYDIHQTTNVNGEYCICDKDWTGVECDHSVEYCDGDTNPCYHGGKCIEGTLASTGSTVHVCDCRNAVENGVKYVGLHCEQPSPENHPQGESAVSDAIKCNEEGTEFCLNGGTCRGDNSASLEECNCPAQWTGKHCEIESANNIQCKLRCENGGICELGLRDKTVPEQAFDGTGWNPNDLASWQHCVCPTDFSGTLCQLAHRPCGDNYCFHGSTCVVSFGPDSTLIQKCECLSAANSTHSFAGLGCQHASTSFCTAAGTPNGQHFCVNDGTCTTSGDGIYNCTCPEGFTGSHCEFTAADEIKAPEIKECKTTCLNGGECREGAKDHGLIENFSELEHMYNETYNEIFEHCVCKSGYSGLGCEHETEVCPSGENLCFNGAMCVLVGDEWRCNCGEMEQPTAGRHCEHKATSQCQADMFCTNMGRCNGDTCICPDGFSGKHCELVRSSEKDITTETDDDVYTNAAVLPENYNENSNTSIIVACVVVAVVGLVIIVGTVIVTNKNASHIETRQAAPPSAAFLPATSVENDLQSGSEVKAGSADSVQSGDAAGGTAATTEEVKEFI